MPSDTTNRVWCALLGTLLRDGAKVAPRDQVTYEILGKTTIVDMTAPVVTVPERKLGYKFLAAESAWILSGDNRLSTIGPFAKKIADTCDDGLTFRGAYGPKFVDQLGYVVATLRKDPSTRQALMTLWRERPGASLDVPCSIALQWLIRNGKLHCVTTMRSSDAWLGWPYDVHAFSMMSATVALSLRTFTDGVRPELGNLILTAGSQHLYDRNADDATTCALTFAPRDDLVDQADVPPTPTSPTFDLSKFAHPDELTEHLWKVARGESTNRTWLVDLANR